MMNIRLEKKGVKDTIKVSRGARVSKGARGGCLSDKGG